MEVTIHFHEKSIGLNGRLKLIRRIAFVPSFAVTSSGTLRLKVPSVSLFPHQT